MRPKLTILAALLILPACASAQQRQSAGLAETVNAAIESNLSVKLAAAQDDAARARVLQRAAALLPDVLGTASQSRTFKYNVTAVMGFGGIAGPFNTFDARIRLTQQLLDIASLKHYQAAKADTEASAQIKALAREQVAAAAALGYIEAARARKALSMALADFDLAKTLLDLAQHQHDNGLVTGLDVARAKTRLSDANVALLNAQSTARQSTIRLKRVAGWPLEGEIDLKDDIDIDSPELPPVAELCATAADTRPELAMYRHQAKAAMLRLSAAKAGHLPSLSVRGDYGLSGNQGDSNAVGTSGVGAYLSLPLFSGGRISGEVTEAQSNVLLASDQLDDARIQVEEDVRLSRETAQEAQHEVALARESVALAQQELTMSRDRYAQGVSDNIDVVTAQVELANVRNSYVGAVARSQEARLNLAQAIGRAQTFTLK